MLDLLRVFSKGWLAKILIALLVVSFGVWGISGSLFFGNQTTVIEVGETKVDAVEYRFAYDNQLVDLSRRMQRRLTRQEADMIGLRQTVLSQMVAGALLDENARKMGLGISDETLAKSISDDPTFRDLSGNFSRSALRSALRNAGLSEDEYINSRKRISMRNQILDGTAASLDMPETFLKALSDFQNEQRTFEFVTLGAEVSGEVDDPSAGDLETYFEANKQDYVAPEYRKLAILKLVPEDLAKPEDVSEEELQAAYENRKANLRQPEKREIEQLVLSASSVDTVKQRLADGVDFETIVNEQGKTLSDINLGLLSRDEIPDKSISDAAFEAELNKPTDIIDGLFGPVLLRAVRIEPEQTTPFEAIKDQLQQEIALERAVEDVFSIFNSVEDERGAGETVLATGTTLNLDTEIIESVDSSGLDINGEAISGVPELPELLREAFEAQPGDDTRAVEIGENGFLWFDVLEITPERQKSLEEVKDAATAAWKSSQVDERIAKVADSIITRVQAGSDFNMVLAELVPTDSLGQTVTFSVTEPLSRDQQSQEFPSAAVRAGFGISTGKTDKVRISTNRYAVFRVADSQVPVGASVDDAVKQSINQAASQDILGQVVDHLQSRDPVLINQGAIDLALSAGRGRGGY